MKTFGALATELGNVFLMTRYTTNGAVIKHYVVMAIVGNAGEIMSMTVNKM